MIRLSQYNLRKIQRKLKVTNITEITGKYKMKRNLNKFFN